MSACGCLRHARPLATCDCMCPEHDREFSGDVQVLRRALRQQAADMKAVIASLERDVERLFSERPALSGVPTPGGPARHRAFGAERAVAVDD